MPASVTACWTSSSIAWVDMDTPGPLFLSLKRKISRVCMSVVPSSALVWAFVGAVSMDFATRSHPESTVPMLVVQDGCPCEPSSEGWGASLPREIVRALTSADEGLATVNETARVLADLVAQPTFGRSSKQLTCMLASVVSARVQVGDRRLVRYPTYLRVWHERRVLAADTLAAAQAATNGMVAVLALDRGHVPHVRKTRGRPVMGSRWVDQEGLCEM